MIVEYEKIDETDKEKSRATVIFDEETRVTVTYWHSSSLSTGADHDKFIIALALYELGKKDEAIEFLKPLAKGKDTRFHKTEKDENGNNTTVFGGEDTRNWAKKLLDERA